jgi:hypothetical protein
VDLIASHLVLGVVLGLGFCMPLAFTFIFLEMEMIKY